MFGSSSLQEVEELEESINEATMALQGNADVLTSLHSFYKSLLDNREFSLANGCVAEINAFLLQVKSFISDSNMQIARGKLHAKIVEARKVVVSHSTSAVRHLFWRQR